MKRCVFGLLLVFALLSASAWGEEKVYPYRWFYVSRSLRDDRDVEEIRHLVQTAAEHRLNGMVLAAGLDRLDLQPPEYLRRLNEVKRICEEFRVEIIPIFFSAGYGGSVLAHDRSLAAGIPVKEALFVVKGEEAHLVPDPKVSIVNSGFEDYQGNRLKGHRFHDRPGEVSFVDTQVFKKGKASLRFENFGNFPHGHGRLMQEVTVKPYRCYRVSCWVKTEDLEPTGCFRLQVLTQDGRALAPWDPRVPSKSDWRKVVLGFNSSSYDKVRLYAGVWGGKSGRFWVDELHIKEVGLVNILRRSGTPIMVRGEKRDIVYQEGRDYAPITDPKLNFRFDHDGPSLRILPNSGIQDGERLRVSYYHGIAINRGQVSVCMSEPKLYEIWRKQAHLIHSLLAPTKYLLNMDEIRAGGSCQACKRRGMTMAQILGDCITRQFNIIREINPKAEVFIWSDMLDPNHNARGNYYLVEGDFTGSWNYIPKDLVIVCWYYKKRSESLQHFSSLGFRTLAGAYYDGDTLENPKGWLQALDQTPSACGIMYTTWRNKYALLAPFGDLVSRRR